MSFQVVPSLNTVILAIFIKKRTCNHINFVDAHYILGQPVRDTKGFIIFVLAIITPSILILIFRCKVEHARIYHLLSCWLCCWYAALRTLLPHEELPWRYTSRFLISCSLEEHRGSKCEDLNAPMIELVCDPTAPHPFQAPPGSRNQSSQKPKGEFLLWETWTNQEAATFLPVLLCVV